MVVIISLYFMYGYIITNMLVGKSSSPGASLVLSLGEGVVRRSEAPAVSEPNINSLNVL